MVSMHHGGICGLAIGICNGRGAIMKVCRTSGTDRGFCVWGRAVDEAACSIQLLPQAAGNILMLLFLCTPIPEQMRNFHILTPQTLPLNA